MHFPFSYTGELGFYKPDNFDLELFLKQIKSKISVTSFSEEQFTFMANYSYSKLPVKIVLTISDDNTSIYCSYKISLFESNTAFLLSLVFAGFFFRFGSNLFGSVSLIVGVFFYVFNTLKISNTIKALIYSTIGKTDEVGEPALWKMQQQWMKNKTLCPACGEPKNLYSNKCINCGLYFSKKKSQFNAINTSSPNNKKVTYKLTKKGK